MHSVPLLLAVLALIAFIAAPMVRQSIHALSIGGILLCIAILVTAL